MEQHNLHLSFLDIVVNKDPDTNNSWMNMFYKKLILVDVSHLNLATTNNAKTVDLLHPLEGFGPFRKTAKWTKKRLDEIPKVLFSQEYPQNLLKIQGPQKIRLIAIISHLLQLSV